MSTDIPQESSLPDVDTSTTPDAPDAFVESTTEASTEEQLQQIWSKVSDLLAYLPDYVTDFFKAYQRPLITVLFIIAALISVKLTLAILGALNDIPLLSPTLELIGLVYSAWFISRYLWRASDRQELLENFNNFKDQVLGHKA